MTGSVGRRLAAIGGAVLLAGGGTVAHAQATTCQNRQTTVLDTRNAVLVSGTALAVGSVYRFANAASGIDVLVRVDALTNTTLGTIDNDAGLVGNFQPELVGSGARSADFTITFVRAGTSTPVALDVTASGIDIDGDSAQIREYAEFSLPLAAYVLDSSTSLDVNASGPSGPNRIRFESRTSFTAPGIDETATGYIASILYTGTSSFAYRTGVLGTGNTTRLTSLDFGCPNIPLPKQNTQVPQDFGDAPASYGDPAHDIVAGWRIGATNTSEPARYNSPTASGDAGDDGVTFPALLRRSTAGTVAVAVAAPTGVTTGRLQAWVDWNGNRSFADAGEQVATDIADNGPGDTDPATGRIAFALTPPANAVLTPTFARVRWSGTTGLTSTSTASNGEVEDYQVTVYGPAVLGMTKTSTLATAPTPAYAYNLPATT